MVIEETKDDIDEDENEDNIMENSDMYDNYVEFLLELILFMEVWECMTIIWLFGINGNIRFYKYIDFVWIKLCVKILYFIALRGKYEVVIVLRDNSDESYKMLYCYLYML